MTHPTTQKLRTLMEAKQTNLSLSLDVIDKKEFLKWAEALGPYICVLKSHIDMIEGVDDAFILELQAIARRQHFLLFEDRKFADIGETVKHQFSKGVFHIRDWADIINAHGVAGPGIIDSLKGEARPETGLLLLAEMSSKGNLLTPEATQTMVSWADQHPDFVMGFIAQRRLPAKHDFMVLSPGVHLDQRGDSQNQQYRTPKEAILRDGCDIIIVGRSIYGARDPSAEALRYRNAGWEAYTLQKSGAKGETRTLTGYPAGT